jgi:site-specific recombinase XerD
MLQQGVHPKIVQERLGHATIAVTLDIYSHVLPGLQEAAARAFDKALGLPIHPEVADKEILKVD